MKKIKYSILLLSSLVVFNSCLDDLNTEPVIEQTLENILKKDPNAAKGLVSRLYATFALSSVNGPGESDLTGANAGESPFLRGISNLQDFSADGMKNRWGDNGLDQLTTASSWNASNKFFGYIYDRIYYVIPQTTNLIVALDKTSIADKELYKNEARFLRSLAYYYLIDLFGKGPLVTTENYGESNPLKESSRSELFAYVETELKDLIDKLPATNEYGRTNKQVARMLLAKLYINAEVYTGSARYNDCVTLLNGIISEGGYILEPNFRKNFSSDNNTSREIIYGLIADAISSQSYGNTTYIVNGSLNGSSMPLANFGATGGWVGHRATKAWYGLFANTPASLNASADARAKLFWTDGHSWEMNDYKTFTDGYPSTKFWNRPSTDNPSLPAAVSTEFSSTDFPLFRYADVLLMYAECALRGVSNANLSTALTYVNQVRTRAGASTITFDELNLSFIIDERGRELNLEGHRRTDLIRFGRFTGGSYLWPWKGGVSTGNSISSDYNLYPIPLNALGSNPNLTQNPGY